MKISWKDVTQSYLENPRDVQTIPKINKNALWFHVSYKDNKLLVSQAKHNIPSCSIKRCRTLPEKEFEKMMILYLKREAGLSVSKEAGETTYHQVYWYGVIDDVLQTKKIKD